MKVYDKKVEIENKFTDWVNSGDEQRYEKFGNTLNLIKEAYEDNRELNISRTYLNEAIFQGAEIMYFSFVMNRKLANVPTDKDEKVIFINEIREEAKGPFRCKHRPQARYKHKKGRQWIRNQSMLQITASANSFVGWA